jgi:outer membrane murein-binding lipoprotein Lpp
MSADALETRVTELEAKVHQLTVTLEAMAVIATRAGAYTARQGQPASVLQFPAETRPS